MEKVLVLAACIILAGVIIKTIRTAINKRGRLQTPIPATQRYLSQMEERVGIALNGSRKIRITFKKKDTTSALYLRGMAKSGSIKLDENVEMDLDVVGTSQKWDCVNRTITVVLTDQFDEEWFFDKLTRHDVLEQIEVID